MKNKAKTSIQKKKRRMSLAHSYRHPSHGADQGLEGLEITEEEFEEEMEEGSEEEWEEGE